MECLTVVAWVRTTTRVRISMNTVNDRRVLDMTSFRQGVEDIVKQKKYPPTSVRTALDDTIQRRERVTACYAQLGLPDQSASTRAHQHFTAQLVAMRARLATIQAPPGPEPIEHTIPLPSPSTRSSFNTLEGDEDIPLENGQVFQDIKTISEGIWHLAYLIHQSTLRFRSAMETPRAFAQAAWITEGASAEAKSICARIEHETGMRWPGLFVLLFELRKERSIDVLEMLPLHEYVEDFGRAAVQAGKKSAVSASNKKFKAALKKPAEDDPQDDVNSSAHRDYVLTQILIASLELERAVRNDQTAVTWLTKFPVVRTFLRYNKDKTKGKALLGTIDAMFLLQTSVLAKAANNNDQGWIEKALVDVIEFATSVMNFMKTMQEGVFILLSSTIEEEMGEIADVCELVKILEPTAAIAMPWTIGNQVLAILEALDRITPTLIHQHKIVGIVLHVYNALKQKVSGFEPIKIFETLTEMLWADVFFPKLAGKKLPTDKFATAFENYGKTRPPVREEDDQEGYFTSHDGKRGSLSVVHQFPFALSNDDSPKDKNTFLKKLRGGSADPGKLPDVAKWNTSNLIEQLRYTADAEFYGKYPLARANFVAIYLLCFETLAACNKVPFAKFNPGIHLVQNMANKPAEILKDLDATKPGKVNATGAVAELVKTFRGFVDREAKELYWEKL